MSYFSLKNLAMVTLPIATALTPILTAPNLENMNLGGYGIIGVVICVLLYLLNYFMKQSQDIIEKREVIYSKQAESLDKLTTVLNGILSELKIMEVQQAKKE